MPLESKTNQTGIMLMESVDNHAGWGSDSKADITVAGGAKPYLSLMLDKEFSNASEESITDGPYKQADSLVTISSENPYSFNNRFQGRGDDFTWMFGFESILPVVAYRVTTDPSSAPVYGDVYTDAGGNSLEFLRTEEFANINGEDQKLYIFANMALANISKSDSTETLTADTGATGTDITTAENYGSMFEHLYELPRDRSQRDFTADEQAAITTPYTGIDLSGDFDFTNKTRQLMATFAKRYSNYALVSNNAMCEGFTVTASPAGYVTAEAGSVVHFNPKIVKGVDYDNIDWTIPCESKESNGNIIHAQTAVYIKDLSQTDPAPTKYGITDYSVGSEFSLDKQQSTLTGYYHEEPELTGFYGASCSFTIARANGTVMQEIRNAQSYIGTRFVANKGGLMQEIVVKKSKVTNAGADDSEIAAEPIELNPSATCDGDEYTEHFDNREVYGNSPIVMRVRDYNGKNAMLGQSITLI